MGKPDDVSLAGGTRPGIPAVLPGAMLRATAVANGCGPEIFNAVRRPPSPGDIRDVSRRAPASLRYRSPAAIDVDGDWSEPLPQSVPENQAPKPSVVCRDCSG